MKKQINRSRLHRWTSFLLVFMLVSGMFASPIKVYANPYSGGDGNCTYTAWRLAYANTGIQLPAWGNAGTWYNSARNAGYTVSTVPRAKSIAVWSGGPSGYGHVAYVTEVSGDQIYIQEGGYDGGYHEGWENAYGQTKYYHLNYLTMIGYIYLGDTSPTIPSGYLNVGQSFNAMIVRVDVWRQITVNGDNVVLAGENKADAKQQWHFERQSDGSYIITSLYDGRALDVAGAGTSNGTNVGLCPKWGTDNGAQKWFIYANQAAMRLVPKNAPDKSLDCATGSTAAGTNIQIYQLNDTAAQVFSIYGFDWKVPQSVKDTDYSLKVGEACALTAAVEPADCAYQSLNYSVADSSIATIKDGKLVGVAQGATTLTVTSVYNDRLKCTVNVNVADPDTVAPTIKAEIREIKEDSMVIYLEVEDDKKIGDVWFNTLELYNPETQKYFQGIGAVGGYDGIKGKPSFAGEIELRLFRDRLAGDEHLLTISVYDDSGNKTEIRIPFSLPSGLQLPVKTGETIDEKTLFEKCGSSNVNSAGWQMYCCETTDFVTFTEGSKTLGADDYYNGTYTINKPGRYSLVYVNNQTGATLPVTFDITCGHENVQTQGARVKTCAADGYTGDVICCDCYEVIEQGTVIPADGHAWSDWRTIRQTDCVNAGKRQRTCENCDETETKEISPTGHQGGTATCIAAAVCDICHEEYGDINPKNHESVQTQGTRVKTCATDGYTGDVICCDCNEVIKRGTVIPADGHAWSAWRTIQQADCVNTGKRQRTCENCDETESKKITALGHDIVTDKAVPATTSSTGLTKGSHCGVCGEILEAQKIVPKLEKVTKPKAPTVKLTTKKKTVQIKISKVSEASGYEIYRSKSKSSGYKKITSTKKISYTNKGLTAKKTYYYKVRAYKTANGKKVYGNWSKVMKIKVKK